MDSNREVNFSLNCIVLDASLNENESWPGLVIKGNRIDLKINLRRLSQLYYGLVKIKGDIG